MEEMKTQEPPSRRRSSRIVLRVPLLVNTTEESGSKEWELVKTVVVSAHGAMIRSLQGFEVGTTLDIRMQNKERSARAKVVWASSKMTPEGLELGFEILDQEGFWDINFPPDTVPQQTRP